MCQTRTAAAVLALLCVVSHGSPADTAAASSQGLSRGRSLQAGARQLPQLQGEAGWLFSKASSADDSDNEDEVIALTPAERAQQLRDGTAVDLAALLEIKQLFEPGAWQPLDTWVEHGDPCTFVKVTCDAKTGRLSEIDLTVTENLAARYPELRSVIAAFEQNQTEQQLATNKRSVQATSKISQQQAPWEDPTIPKSITAWPAGMYPYTPINMKELPSGSAFMKLNQTLRALHISNAQLLQRTLPTAWGSFSALRELTLTGLELDSTLPAQWSGMINMTQLILADNPNLHGSLPESWGALQKLRILDLSLNYADGLRSSISGVLPHSWSTMVKLETLNLWRTSIVGHLPAAWANMKRLQVLALSDTGVSGCLPSAWSKMPTLATVHVANTLVSGSLPSSWAKMQKLAMLDLRGTSVLQPMPASWQALCKRDGVRVWDTATQAYTRPPSLQYGKVVHVYLPWSGPDGVLWEINHNASSPCNMCQQLLSERSMWAPVAFVVCSVFLVLASLKYRARALSLFHYRSGRFD